MHDRPSPSLSTSQSSQSSQSSINTKPVTIRATTHQNDNVSTDDPLTICTDLNQAAKLIVHQSFAILQVDKDTQRSLTHAWNAASEFFSSSISFQKQKVADTRSTAASASIATIITARYYDDDEKEEEVNLTRPKQHRIDEVSFLSKYRRISHGNLLGFNRPSPAKVLFRAFCSNWGKDNNQPWPHSRFSLRRRSVDLSTRLHDLLVQCVHMIQRECEREVSEIGHGYNCREEEKEEDVVCKRRKTVLSPSPRYHLFHQEDSNHSSLQIPKDMMDAGLYPLDYFFLSCPRHYDKHPHPAK